VAQVQRENRLRRIARNALGYLVLAMILAVFATGLTSVARFMWAFRSHLAFLIPAGSWFNTYVWQHPDGWVTALATVFLFWATLALMRSTRAQVAGDAPLLHYNLMSPDAPSIPTGAYNESWALEDERHVGMAPHLLAGPGRYIHITVANEQAKPYGVALGVKLTVRLAWGASNNTDLHPYTLDRVINQPAIGAGKAIGGPLFNIGNIANYVVLIQDVTYTDISGKKSRVAFGAGKLWQRLPPGQLVVEQTVFEPVKRGRF